MVKQTPKCEG